MGNLHLVTGHAGRGHVTAADHGSLNASIFGNGQYVLNRGSKFAATVISNNAIRIADGDILLQGRHVRLNENSYVDLTIENGAQDMLRNDLIVARYSKDSTSGVEDCNLIVIKGTPASADPVDPEYIKGDLMINHDLTADMPLYRVPLNGLAVQELVPLFESFDSGFYEHTLDKTNPHNTTAEQIGARPNTWMPTLVEVGGINKNLLHNWYFADLVNSKGLAKYETEGAVFDRWKYLGSTMVLELTEKGIAAAVSGSIYQYIQQIVDMPADLAGQIMTASVLAESLTIFHLKIFDYSEGKIGDFLGQVGDYLENGRSVLSCSFTVPSGVSKIAFLLYPNSLETEDTVTTTFIAAKMEIGSVQTLAKKDADGIWILTEKPDYAEQAAICAQYNAQTGEYIGLNREALGAAPNKNLLHNWYFPKPVNNKGLTVYPQGVGASFIDRWMKNGSLETTLTDEGIVITASNSATVSFYQFVKNDKLAGKTITASVLLRSSTAPILRMYYHDGTSQKQLKQVTNTFSDKSKTELMQFTAVIPDAAIGVTFQLFSSSEGTEYCADTTFVAGKLEFGSVQTLAHKDENGEWMLNETPDFAEQVAICAQYNPTIMENWTTDTFIGAAKPFALVQSYTASTTLAAVNIGNFLNMNSTDDLTVTIPLDDNLIAPVGVELEICRYSTGNVTVVGESGVSVLSSSGSTAIGNQYGCVTLKKLAANTWLISGDLG